MINKKRTVTTQKALIEIKLEPSAQTELNYYGTHTTKTELEIGVGRTRD
jgi:hypothetical protein